MLQYLEPYELEVLAIAAAVTIYARFISSASFRIATKNEHLRRAAWVAVSGIAAGVGTFTMQVVATLAFYRSTAGFEVAPLVVSLVIDCIGTTACMAAAVGLAAWRAVLAGLIGALTVTTTNYIDIAAIAHATAMTWHWTNVASSFMTIAVLWAVATVIAVRAPASYGFPVSMLIYGVGFVGCHVIAVNGIIYDGDLAEAVAATLSAKDVAVAVALLAIVTFGAGTVAILIEDGSLRNIGLLKFAADNISQGLAMFDKDLRLVVCNDRFIEMYGLQRGSVYRGTPMTQIVRQRAALGNLGVDPGEYGETMMRALAMRQATSRHERTGDGRTILVRERPLENGCWVVTHEDVTVQKEAEGRLLHVARHDALTELANRAYLKELLERATDAATEQTPIAFLFLDLDRFKAINDTLGHAMGDKVLMAVADRLRGAVRQGDRVGRLGGDEFGVIMTSLSCASDAAELAGRIRRSLAAPYSIGGQNLTIDVSIGISIAPDDADDAETLLTSADMALYEAKRSARGSYCFYTSDLDIRVAGREALERDMRAAIDRGEFEVFYQPIAAVSGMRISGFEALVRWRHPTRGMVSPSEFIPIAEDSGLIGRLGRCILRKACAEAARWREDIDVAVNISPLQLGDKAFAAEVEDAIVTSGLDPRRLVLEITESALIGETSSNLPALRTLHERGVRFAMDDFGTGYSSLGYLLNFPFSKIKIDRSFIKDIAWRREPRAVVRAVLDLSRNLDLVVVAEGVEEVSQLEALRELGCVEMQGFLLSQPRPAAEIRTLFPEVCASEGVERLRLVAAS